MAAGAVCKQVGELLSLQACSPLHQLGVPSDAALDHQQEPIHTEPVISTPLACIPVYSYVGGLRRLTAAEREEWRRHGAPRPPAPGQLAALEAAAAAEEDWSSDEEELIEDLELGRSKAGQPGQDWQRWWEARIWQLLRGASPTIPCCTQCLAINTGHLCSLHYPCSQMLTWRLSWRRNLKQT